MPLKPFKRIIHGDLRETYEQLVSNAPESEERGEMMAVMNVMCGNVEIECAFAVLKAQETKEEKDQRRDQDKRLVYFSRYNQQNRCLRKYMYMQT